MFNLSWVRNFLLISVLSACGGGSDIPAASNDTGYTLGVTVSGLTVGENITLRNIGSANLVGLDNLLPVSGSATGNVSATFNGYYENGSPYDIRIHSQPASGFCSVSNGSGMVAANVSNIAVVCTANPTGTYTVNGTVQGIPAGASITLQNNAGDNLVLSADGSFSFATPIASNAAYAVTLLTPPSGSTCTIANGSGVMGSANVSNVAVNCGVFAKSTVGGTLTGLPVGSTVVLQNSGFDNATLATNSAFTFPTQLPPGTNYAVVVQTQPTGATCAVVNGSGVMGNVPVSNIAVNCGAAILSSNSSQVNVSVSGLSSGTSLVLQNNGADNLTVGSNGTSGFATKMPSGNAYSVIVLTQPSGQTCSVSSGSGTANYASTIQAYVSCSTASYTVGGTVTGLPAGKSVGLSINGGAATMVSANGAYVLPAQANGSDYSVTVSAQPADVVCSVASGTGTIAGANVTNVAISCSPGATVGGSISGLPTNGIVVLQNNGADDLTITQPTSTFTFPTPITFAQTYKVTVKTQPAGSFCTPTVNSGTMGSTAVSNVVVTCVSTYPVAGVISSLAAGASVVLQNNGADNLTLNVNGAYTFPTQLGTGKTYNLTVLTDPVAPAHPCQVIDGAGTVADANVVNTQVVCGVAVVTLAGSAGMGGFGVAVDAAGNVYVGDTANNRIRKITPAGAVSTVAGSGVAGFLDSATGLSAQFNSPRGIAVDTAGNLYVADYSNQRIRKITPAGAVSTLAGSGVAGYLDSATGSTAQFSYPQGVAVDTMGNVYVADMANNRIRKITPAGAVGTLAGSIAGYLDSATGALAKFNWPQGIAVDAVGNVYVADTNNERIRKITPAGAVSTLAGSGVAGFLDSATGALAKFNYPQGIAVDTAGNVYVADNNNERIRKITPAGAVSTLAGDGTAGSADGPAAVAQFSSPQGVAVDTSGNVYVNDIFNSRIRKIIP